MSVLALLIGGLLAVQASVNLQLNKALGTPYGASTLQLSVATVLLAIVTAVLGGLGALGELTNVEPWKLVGGVASPIYITSAILLLPRLGALTSVGLFVTGQMLASLVLDSFGLLGLARLPLNAGSIAGAAIVITGITLVIRAQRAASQRSHPGWLLLGLLAGAVLPVQGAINAALRADLKQPLAVGLTSFLVATATIVVVLLFLRISGRTPAPAWRGLGGMPWWGWLGGAAAAVYVTATFSLIPVIGTATTIALTVTGQQLASAAIDHFGAFRLPRRALNQPRFAGLVLLVGGSALLSLT